MILDKFIKQSKWQNASPEARRATLEEINDPAVLSEIVQQADESALVRRAAVKKIDDLELLDTLAKTDADLDLRDQANQRFKQVLCGKQTNLDVAARLAWVQQSSDANLLEHVAKNAQEAELRLAALAKVTRESVFGDVAIDDAKPEVRLAAVEKLTQKSTLERVFKAMRSQDKQVSRIAREKLDSITEQLERPARLKSEAEAMCTRLEALLKLQNILRHWEADKAEFDRLAARWQVISTEVDAAFEPRFTQAQQEFQQAYAQYQQHQAEMQQREQEYAPIRAAKQQLCEHIEALLSSVTDVEIAPAPLPWTEEKLAEWHTQWEYIGTLHPTEEVKWQQRLDRAVNVAQQHLRAWQDTTRLARKAKDLLRYMKDLNHSSKAIKPAHLKDVQQRYDTLVPVKPSVLWETLELQLKQQIAQLEATMHQQVEDAKQAEITLQTLLKELETALEQGVLHDAMPLEQKARELLKNAVAMPTSKQQLLEKRLQKNGVRIRELRDWELWGDDLERVNLCTRIEEIIPYAADDPEETARLVREAQESWKKMDEHGHPHRFRRKAKDDAAGTPKSEDIYKRFIKACNEAYEPCRQYFEKKAKERAENLLKKEHLCQKIEQYIQDTSWEYADWKKVHQFVRDVDKEWHRIGTTDRKTRKKLKERYESGVKILETHLDAEREHNLRQREALINVVRAVSRGEELSLNQAIAQLVQGKVTENSGDTPDSPVATHEVDAKRKSFDLDKAIKRVIDLQKQWSVSVPSDRKTERDLWKQFRDTCDTVFNMRDGLRKQKDQEVQDQQEAKEALCAQFETFVTSVEDEQLKNAPSYVKNLRMELMDNLATLPKKSAEALEKRFKNANKRLDERYHQLLQNEKRKQLDLLKHKAELCAEIEHANMDTVAEVVARVKQVWADLPSLLETPLESGIQRRFELACQSAGNTVFLPTVLKEKEELCIRLEILAAVDSPSEAKDARMAYQVKRLSEAMKGGNLEGEPTDKVTESQDIERAWYLIGAIPAEVAHSLEQRFSHALHAIEQRRSSRKESQKE
jgi:hypothetical protein